MRGEEGSGYYSPPPSGSHNLSYGAPIEELFAATRSSCQALHFYLSKPDKNSKLKSQFCALDFYIFEVMGFE
ncbi:uncharacterized protein DS421_11g323430 [Arachis hypogaea]|nr:uncharacterized protein DS421_11g323430 [Arachis hypogaea]